MFVLFTDFGLNGPYIGQVKAVLYRAMPDWPVIDLFADAPQFDPRASAYLLAAYATAIPPGSVVVAVVDPGVGSDRRAVALRVGERWYVAPDNGLLAIVARKAKDAEAWRIDWRPAVLSASFHGRDLFAPVAARLAKGQPPPGTPHGLDRLTGSDWPEDWPAITYIDVYGTAMTGLRASTLSRGCRLEAGGQQLSRVRTFSDVPRGQAFWYENSNGLAEIAVNQGRADRDLTLAIGDPVRILRGHENNLPSAGGTRLDS